MIAYIAVTATTRGGAGNDQAFLSAGADRYIWNSGDGFDTVDGGGGFDIDTLEFNVTNEAETIVVAPIDGTHTLLFNDNTDEFVNMTWIEDILIKAGGGADLIVAAPNVTTTITVNGGAGDDAIVGRGGSDNLNGQAGVDILFGGAGSDDFTFSASDFATGEVDYIADFEAVDRIFLEGWLPFAVIVQSGDHVVIASSESSFTSGFVILDATIAEVQASTVI